MGEWVDTIQEKLSRLRGVSSLRGKENVDKRKKLYNRVTKPRYFEKNKCVIQGAQTL